MREHTPTKELWEFYQKKLMETKHTRGRTNNKRIILDEEKKLIIQLINHAKQNQIDPRCLAEELRCSYQNIYQFFTGCFGVSIKMLVKIAKAMGKKVVIEIK